MIRWWIASQDFREDIRASDLDKDLKNASSILNVVAVSLPISLACSIES